jgi:hypothetical protein
MDAAYLGRNIHVGLACVRRKIAGFLSKITDFASKRRQDIFSESVATVVS